MGSTSKSVGASGPSPANAVLTAYTQTVHAKTAEVSINETVTATSAGKSTQHVTVSETGMIDFANQDGQFSFSAPTTGVFAARFINPVLYVQVPADQRSQLPAGKSWAAVNLNTVAEAKLGASLDQLTSSSQAPTQTLSYLQAVSRNGITTVGPATTRGAATTEYKATIDLTKVADQKGAGAQAALKDLEGQLHTTTLPVQVWLDAQNRVRQVAYQLHVSTTGDSPSSGGTTLPAVSGLITSTIDYYDFGIPVHVAAPPAQEIENVTGQAVAATSTTTS